MLIFVEHIFLSLPSRPVAFLGSLLLSAVGPGIDYFQLLVLIEVFVALLQLVTAWAWVEFDFPPPPILHIFMQFSSMSGAQILDPYFLLSFNRQYFSMCERTLLVLQMHVYNMVQPSCIYNKESWFQSLSLIKVWHDRVSGFSKVIGRVVMVMQRHCQNLAWQYPWRYFSNLH